MKQIPDLKYLLEDFYWRLDDKNLLNKNTRFNRDDFDIYLFSQTWGSTALGFDGFGGQEVVSAYTTVILYEPLEIYAIYFGEDFAYFVMNPNDKFYYDLGHLHMNPVCKHPEYELKESRRSDEN